MSTPNEVLQQRFEQQSFFSGRGLFDWLWALLVAAAAGYTYVRYSAELNQFEMGILAGTAAGLIWLGWRWPATRWLLLTVAALSLSAINIYGNDLGRAQSSFLLKFLISSQSAIMWMSALYVAATLTYFAAMLARSEFTGKVATALTWAGTAMGLVGLMVRWRESYLLGHDIGHIPVSNLYEVFILFALVTSLLYLYYEGRYRTRALGGFVMLIVSAAIGFLLWYQFDRQANEIEALVPALQSYWMKIHVPANFIGYGSFALAAMVGVAHLVKGRAMEHNPQGFIASRLPALEMMDDLMYKSIALGFAFFTVATVLGAMWAAEAWGGYWSWDPKETWALIVWLNYAAWLHMRLTKGWRGKPLAWWAVGGLLVTTFAFLGVNMFLSGLHSYGEL